MKNCVFPAIVLALFCCDNRLTDEQRKKMKEQMDLHKIKRVTEVQLTEEAYRKGREALHAVSSEKDTALVGQLIASGNGVIRFIRPGDKTIHRMEAELMEAYRADSSAGSGDNVQKIRDASGVETDSILFTSPVYEKYPGKQTTFSGMWSVWLSKKKLIIGIK